ncbi:MAG TPA: RsmE family RNA methyltransferase [Thermoanaerobaculia bacterium]|nr:RsmE family RNA methyltransferase [Thermoanaerobaculia bacterium]
MKNRFFVPAIEETITLTGDELHHARVLRLRDGEEVEVFDGRGAIARARFEANVLHVLDRIDSRESPLAIDLAMAIINLDKFELVLQKATELGVRSIIPLVTERVELRPERYRGKAERWEKIVFEAVKQSGRSMIARVEAPEDLETALQRNNKILFDADADETKCPPSLESVTVFIGPEGGWSDDEVTLARAHGCAIERLGPRRLRAETAAIAACVLVEARWGDLRS